MAIRKSLEDAVLDASQATSWEQAVAEWSQVSLIFNGLGGSNCICGNRIKYAYELFNQVTGRRLFPIGSDCVRHFQNEILDESLQFEEKLLHNLHRLIRKVERNDTIKISKQDFDEDLLDWLWQKGAFKADRSNHFKAYADYQLFLEVFKGGSWTQATPEKRQRMEQVLDCYIKPFLLGRFDEEVYLVQLGKEKVEFEQELREKAELERCKREQVMADLGGKLPLALGPAEKAYQAYFSYEKPLSKEEREWEGILYGNNQNERLLKTKQVQKEVQKGKRVDAQNHTERKQKQVWLVNSSFRQSPEDKARLGRLAAHYRKTGQIPLEELYFSDYLLDFFFKMKVFEFEIHPEKVLEFLKYHLVHPTSYMERIWVQDILDKDVKPFLDRYLL